MSSTQQYVYIPNLVGRQMLRIPVEDVETSNTPSTTGAPQLTINTTTAISAASAYPRDASPAPSMESVSEAE